MALTRQHDLDHTDQDTIILVVSALEKVYYCRIDDRSGV